MKHDIEYSLFALPRRLLCWSVLLLLALPGCSGMQPLVDAKPQQTAVVATPPLDAPLPFNPEVMRGRLDNGVTYYISVNREPRDRADLRLFINAGSVLEDEAQLGLAHFVEHMAFNGTSHFPSNSVIDTLETMGTVFGPGVNAATGFDSTAYQLRIPTDDPAMLDTGLLVLADWAHNISFDPAEIEDERGVVLEEWRLGRGAAARMRDKTLPVLLHNSRYATRLPIGSRRVLENFDPGALTRFYRTWYRPDLMAVVAVGDFDPDAVKAAIIERFGKIPMPPTVVPRSSYPVPDHAQPLFVIATDPEATGTRVALHFKRDVMEERTVGDYRKRLVERLYNSMLNARFDEIVEQAAPPFLAATSNSGQLTRTKEVYTLSARVDEKAIRPGLEALLLEAERVRRYGFGQFELERQKKNMLTSLRRLYQERDKTDSSLLAAESGRNFLVNEPMPGIAYEYDLVRTLLPTITLAETAGVTQGLIRDQNRVVVITAPQKDLDLPDEPYLADLLARLPTMEIAPHEDQAVFQPLMNPLPNPAPVVSENKIAALGITEWRLTNHIRVLLKPTAFKNDAVLFGAFSPGGNSLVNDQEYIAALTAVQVVTGAGVGKHSRQDLKKILAGRTVAVSPGIGELTETLAGGGAVQDLEVMFQLIYLSMTAPRADAEFFQSLRTRMRTALANRLTRPEAVFFDTISEIMSQGHFRRRPMSVDRLAEMDLADSLAVYQDRFGDAGDFTFIFVGNFSLASIRPLVERYLGSLPTNNRMETWRDPGVESPKGRIHKEIRMGLAPKALTAMIFSGSFDWRRENRFLIQTMADLFRRRLRERLREEMGSTYNVEVAAHVAQFPKQEYEVTITFGSAPERTKALIDAVLHEIELAQQQQPSAEEMAKIKEAARRQRESDLRSNRFWLSVLQFYAFHGEDPLQILEFDALIDELTGESLRQAAGTYLNMDNYAEVVLYPETGVQSASQRQAPATP